MKTILFLLALIPSLSLASVDLATRNESCRCDGATQDPYETPIAFSSGVLAGKCIDSCHYRSPKLLTDGDTIELANVLHNDGFKIASVDLSGAYELDILFEQFMPAVNHVAFRVRFAPDKPVRLRSQLEMGSAFSDETHDLIISVEAALPKGESFTFNNARSGAFLLDFRVTSLEETKRWMLGVKKHYVSQYRLRVSPDALPALVRLAIQRGQERSFAVPYYLFTDNCSTEIFDMLDQVTEATPPRGIAWAQRAWPVDGPGTLRYLNYAGLVSKRLPDLDKE